MRIWKKMNGATKIATLGLLLTLIVGVLVGTTIPRDAEAAHLPNPLAWSGPISTTPNPTGTGAQVDNLFTVVGSVEMIVWGELTTGGTFNMTNIKLQSDDGTAQVDVTLDGAAVTNLAAGTMLYRSGLAASALALSNNVASDVIDPGNAGNTLVHIPFVITRRDDAATYVEVSYSTTDTDTTGEVTWYCVWRAMSNDGSVVGS